MQDNLNRHPKTTALNARPLRAVTHKIRQWRQHRGLTTEQVAARALDANGNPMTASLISQVEIGRCAYTQNSLERIGRALNVEPWQLLVVDPGFQGDFLIVGDDDPSFEAMTTEQRAEASAFLREMVNAVRDVMGRRWPGVLRPPSQIGGGDNA